MDENINQSVQALLDTINQITEIDDNTLTDEVVQSIIDTFNENFSSEVIEQSINQIVNNFEILNATKEEVHKTNESLKTTLNETVYGEKQLSVQKKRLVDMVMNSLYIIFDKAEEKYHNYNIILPMTLENGAQEPTYAHDTDAAADLYALEDTHILPETYGNKIRTGVRIQLPEGWMAMIFPRSSTGLKTPLRLSNSVGIIDSGYRGELGVLFDNTSVSTIDIKKGDRIAQLMVMPSYRFKANVVDILQSSERADGGFGSTGV